MKIKNNQNGFTPIAIAVLLALVVSLVLGSYYFLKSDKTKTPSSDTTIAPDTEKSSRIGDFNIASDSLKKALIDEFYDDAKKQCEQSDMYNETLNYIEVKKMVRDDFALAKWCGSGANSVLARMSDGKWKVVADTSQAPQCKLVDQYKISKEAVKMCFPEGKDEAIEVTYP